MSKIRKIYTTIISPKLTKAANNSVGKMAEFEKENVFQSKTMRTLLTDKFDYKGSKKNTIFVQDAKTLEPVEVKVGFNTKKIGDYCRESFVIRDTQGQIIGHKFYNVQKWFDGSIRMSPGFMHNVSKYIGIGFRLDQLQIERALQLGVGEIRRLSKPQAVIFHSKMGFSPVEDLRRVKSIKEVNEFVYPNCVYKKYKTPNEIFKPIVVQKDGKFYIDVNKTMLIVNSQMCKDIMAKEHSKIFDLSSRNIHMILTDKELQHWKEKLNGHTILDKMKFKLPTY